ncbi:sigma-70 family RNA polymerase sigma factor [Catenulispora yoronensis]|uniref:Sigma-70 family RNA polymerase sigma factor n=1 Tax=Catenulispora yoronensis TaxID=450799 RepID=A0ABP5GKV5_9ACTN
MSFEAAVVDAAVEAAVVEAFHTERTAVLATLIRLVGDFQLAEDALQDAFAAAVATWRREGVPRRPGAWLLVAARRKAVDRLRRDKSMAERAERLAAEMRLHDPNEAGGVGSLGDADNDTASRIDDDLLRLIFTCCHPALDLSARVALTLRTLGGMTTGEIARAFLVAEPTMGKRIVRAKRKIADAHIRYRVPPDEELPERLNGVLRVVHLIFNEGYSAAHGPDLVRTDLCDSAIRLARLLSELMPQESEVWGLLSLTLLHDARRGARSDADGRYVALQDQDRSLWDRGRVSEGLRALERTDRPGTYQIQAVIAALHMQARDPDDTDWTRIAELYSALAQFDPSPVVKVNHATAIGFADGPRAGLALLNALRDDSALAGYQPLHAARAEFLVRAGDLSGAAEAYALAIGLSANAVERSELERRAAAVRRSEQA